MKLKLIIAAGAVAFQAAAGNLMNEVAKVESGGNDRAVGDHGLAVGAWQLHPEPWSDACRRLGVGWPHSSATNHDRSAAVAAEHMRWLQARFTKATGRVPTASDSYALWNLGVAGYHKRGWEIGRCPEITRRGAKKVSEGVGIAK